MKLCCWEHSRHQVPYCLPSCDLVLIKRKTILQISTRPLAYHWEWSATTQHLAQSPDHCVPQNRIPKAYPSTFRPSQINISTFCSQRPLLITTDTLMIIMHPYSSQPTPPNCHTPFDKGDLIPHMGASTNLKPMYTSFPSCTSRSSTSCPTHISSPLQFRVSQTSWFLPQTVNVLNHVPTFSRQENWMYQTTWPHSTNQLQFHSTKRHHDILYASNAPLFK